MLHGEVVNLCFSPDDRYLDVYMTATVSNMIIITVLHIYFAGNKPRGVILASGLGEVRHLCFSPDDQYVAVCSDMEVVVIKTAVSRMLKLKGRFMCYYL